ncbi:retrovirus-related pol polyprotein from transposon TNT 1-94 [Tanacetum coccineum]
MTDDKSVEVQSYELQKVAHEIISEGGSEGIPKSKSKTSPYEIMKNKHHNLSYFRSWGCLASVRIPGLKRIKLASRAYECLFVGYALNSKAYMFFDLKYHVILESNDADFHEHEYPFKSTIKVGELSSRNLALIGNKNHDDLDSEHRRNVDMWQEAINDEMESLESNKIWHLVDLPPGCKMGFKQRANVDFFDTYSLVTRITSIRVLIALASIQDRVVHQMDVKTAFLNGELNEEIYMDQLEGFIVHGQEHKVEEHQYHVDQMQSYLKNDIIWESKKEMFSVLTPKKPTPLYHCWQSDLKAPPMTLLNQDLLYINYGNSGPKKYTLSLHKFPAVRFHDDDIEERTSRWKEQRKNPEEFYSDSKIVKVIKISYELEPDYKYLNKNDIEDLYPLCINGKVKDYKEIVLLGSLIVFIRSTVIWERVNDFQLGMESYQQKVNLTTPTITFPGIKREKLFTITSEPVIGMIYENNKKEKRVMIHKEINKFCDATLKRVLEILRKYNKDVKSGYANLSPSDVDAEYLRFYEEDIEECLKHHDQMRRWEM